MATRAQACRVILTEGGYASLCARQTWASVCHRTDRRPKRRSQRDCAVAWALGRNPSQQFICASYCQDLADKLAIDCRSVMLSAWFKRLFGELLKGARPAVADLHTARGGGRFATSVGGVLTGRGGVLEREAWKVVSLPAIAEVEQCISYADIFGKHEVVRKVGSVLHP